MKLLGRLSPSAPTIFIFDRVNSLTPTFYFTFMQRRTPNSTINSAGMKRISVKWVAGT